MMDNGYLFFLFWILLKHLTFVAVTMVVMPEYYISINHLKKAIPKLPPVEPWRVSLLSKLLQIQW